MDFDEKYARYMADKWFLDIAVRLGHLSKEERILVEFFRAAKPDVQRFFFDLVTSLPRI